MTVTWSWIYVVQSITRLRFARTYTPHTHMTRRDTEVGVFVEGLLVLRQLVWRGPVVKSTAWRPIPVIYPARRIARSRTHPFGDFFLVVLAIKNTTARICFLFTLVLVFLHLFSPLRMCVLYMFCLLLVCVCVCFFGSFDKKGTLDVNWVGVCCWFFCVRKVIAKYHAGRGREGSVF